MLKQKNDKICGEENWKFCWMWLDGNFSILLLMNDHLLGMKKYPKPITLTSFIKGKTLFSYYAVVNVGGLVTSYFLWTNMLKSSDFRLVVHNRCKPILTVFYSVYKLSRCNPPITYESDLSRWKLENKIK